MQEAAHTSPIPKIDYILECNLSTVMVDERREKIHGSRETRLKTEFSASVGTPPPFKDQGADAAPKSVEGEWISSPASGQRPKTPFTASMFSSCQAPSSQLTVGRSTAGKKSFRFQAGLETGTLCFSIMVLDHPTMPA